MLHISKYPNGRQRSSSVDPISDCRLNLVGFGVVHLRQIDFREESTNSLKIQAFRWNRKRKQDIMAWSN
jgi:hypothetical protein